LVDFGVDFLGLLLFLVIFGIQSFVFIWVVAVNNGQG